jgi:regulator of protease activity HflC (stomatin/prohibitin superfamily)
MMNKASNVLVRVAIVGALIVIAFLVLMSFSSRFFYVFEVVEQSQVGVQFRSGMIHDIVGPGVYTDFGLFVQIKTVSSQAVPFSVRDEEIITSDKQRIGLVVSGDVFRPNLAQKDVLLANWAQYSNIYLDDELLKTRISDLTRQAMKVCVGERTFDDAIIGTARDEVRTCVDDELSELAQNYGLGIQNVTIPEVVLSTEVQVALDAIVQSRLSTEKAAQDKLKAEAEALAEQAKREGEIRVEQSVYQEETRQQTILAELEQEKLVAQKVVIEAQKANDLYSAQQDLEINKAQAVAAAEKVKVDLARENALAALYAKYPEYYRLQLALANASALKATDKIIFTLEGMTPTLVLPGPGIVPTVETGQNTPQPE